MEKEEERAIEKHLHEWSNKMVDEMINAIPEFYSTHNEQISFLITGMQMLFESVIIMRPIEIREKTIELFIENLRKSLKENV